MQAPIGSKFNAASTAAEVVRDRDLRGKIAIVTGGYSGIGTETSRVLRRAGAEVIVPVRDRAKAERTLAGLDVRIDALDLADPSSIDGFAERFLATGSPLHMLVNSAGVMACPLERDARGYERQFATNHLGHFQLVARLWPALARAQGARVVCVSSWGHRFSDIVWDDIQFERRPYDRWSAYGQSKTANILHAVAIDARGKAMGIRAFSLHPGGIIDTDLKRHLSQDELAAAGVLDAEGRPVHDPSRQLKTIEEGAATSAWCATSRDLDGTGGVYCENVEVARVVSAQELSLESSTRLVGVRDYAVDPAAADRLWRVSEGLVARRC